LILHILSNFLGYFIGSLILLQYLGSNGYVLNTGFNHTLILQCLICIVSVPCFYAINKSSALKLIGITIIFLLFAGIHYEIVSRANDYSFNFFVLWSYVKFVFYLFVFLSIYLYFNGKDFFLIHKCARFIVLVLFFESLLFLAFKMFGFDQFANLFVSAEGRFAGIFLMNNALVGLFALFVMSYVIYFGTLREKCIYLLIGTLLIAFTGERSIFLGLLFFMFAFLVFSHDLNRTIYKVKMKIFVTLAIILLGFIIIYTLTYRDENISSVGTFLRPLLIRVYFSYLSIVHLFESSNTFFGFGPFINFLPTNVADIHSDYVEKFIKVISNIFGHTEKTYFSSFHDSGNSNSPSYSVNAHNTFVILFYQLGYFFIGIFFYFVYLCFISSSYIKLHLKEISKLSSLKDKQDKNENFFQITSLVFILSSLPPLFFLSADSYLLLTAIALGHLGSFVRKVSDG
jgi:hypothetical protein